VNELSLFTGYGGMTLALRLAGLEVTTVGYVEIDSYCQQLIQARIRDKVLDDAPIWHDIRAFSGGQCRGVVDIITASFPCQPHSLAGQRRGKADERNLWPDTLRVIREVAPRYVLLENVRGLADGNDPYAAEIVGQLSEAGYDARWGLLSAAEVGAPHLRERWWCLAVDDSHADARGGAATVADTSGTGLAQREEQDAVAQQPPTQRDGRERIPNGDILWHWQQLQGQQGPASNAPALAPDDGETGWWAAEPPLDRVVDGYPDRVHELKTIGNGIVPKVAAEFLCPSEEVTSTQLAPQRLDAAPGLL
jgi:DNA (cytosine-5)-methyltransferase 1